MSILSESDIVFDIILLDLSLPDKSGQNLISEMLFIAPIYPIIILTGYTDIEFSIKSISQGIFDYLLKDELTATSLYKSILYAPVAGVLTGHSMRILYLNRQATQTSLYELHGLCV